MIGWMLWAQSPSAANAAEKPKKYEQKKQDIKGYCPGGVQRTSGADGYDTCRVFRPFGGAAQICFFVGLLLV